MFKVDIQHHSYIEPFPPKKVEEHIRYMDSYGISMAVVSNQLPQPTDSNLAIYEKMNSELFALSRANPSRFVACPSIPVHDGRIARQWLDKLSSNEKIRAALIRPIHGRMDSEELDEFFDRASSLGILLLVHPVFRDVVYNQLWGDTYKLGASIGFMVDTTLAISYAIYSGLLERFSKLKLVFHHLGGALPFLLGRLEAVYEESKSSIPKRPTDYFKMLYFDTVCYTQEPLDYTCRLVGSDHLVFGTDFGCPAKGLVRPELNIRLIESLKIPEESKERIFGRNALDLLGLSAMSQVTPPH